ncbi:MAG: hypothetical protein QOD06_1828 [Candidatus Binatota bacterium]|nr:hypothetical protein [Candidatus Binatota bacterium]
MNDEGAAPEVPPLREAFGGSYLRVVFWKTASAF